MTKHFSHTFFYKMTLDVAYLCGLGGGWGLSTARNRGQSPPTA